MTKVEVESALTEEYDFAAGQVLVYGARLSNVARLRTILEALLNVPGVKDVESVTVGMNYARGVPRVELHLRGSAKASSFVREVVKLFHVPFVKEPSGETLRCHADVLGVSAGIHNYLPEGCRVEYHEEFIPGHIEQRPQVICGKKEETDENE